MIEELLKKSGIDAKLTLADMESLHSKKVLEIANSEDEKLAAKFLKVVRNAIENNQDGEVD